MLFARAARMVFSLAAMLSVAACANRPPMALSSQYSPPSHQNWPAKGEKVPHPCRVRVAEIRDLRSDPQAMGTMDGRLIRSADTTAWVRSGFLSLGRDPRLQMVEGDAQHDLAIDADIIKAYAMSVTGETRSANVVLRVHYRRNDTSSGEQIYRGTENGANWSNGEGETQSAFDDALENLLNTVDSDLVARCTSGGQ